MPSKIDPTGELRARIQVAVDSNCVPDELQPLTLPALRNILEGQSLTEMLEDIIDRMCDNGGIWEPDEDDLEY